MRVALDAQETQVADARVLQDAQDMKVPGVCVRNDVHDTQDNDVMHHVTLSHVMEASDYIVHPTVGAAPESGVPLGWYWTQGPRTTS